MIVAHIHLLIHFFFSFSHNIFFFISSKFPTQQKQTKTNWIDEVFWPLKLQLKYHLYVGIHPQDFFEQNTRHGEIALSPRCFLN